MVEHQRNYIHKVFKVLQIVDTNTLVILVLNFVYKQTYSLPDTFPGLGPDVTSITEPLEWQ